MLPLACVAARPDGSRAIGPGQGWRGIEYLRLALNAFGVGKLLKRTMALYYVYY